MELKTAQNLHVGVELGGTSCKTAIFRKEVVADSATFERICYAEFQTSHEDPYVTYDEIKVWLLTKLHETDGSAAVLPASLGIAAFGPMCLDKTSPQYGCITTTPKLAWQNFPVYSLFREDFGFIDRDGLFIDTDVNVCALFEFQEAKLEQAVRESMCYVTVGTGVGIGLIINEQCVHGMMHPEGGHIRVPLHRKDI